MSRDLVVIRLGPEAAADHPFVSPVNRGCVLVSDSAASSTDCHGPDKWSPEELASDAIQRVHVESDLICLHSSTPGERLLSPWTEQRHPASATVGYNG